MQGLESPIGSVLVNALGNFAGHHEQCFQRAEVWGILSGVGIHQRSSNVYEIESRDERASQMQQTTRGVRLPIPRSDVPFVLTSMRCLGLGGSDALLPDEDF